MKVIYPVLFYKEKENGYSVFVPDLDNASTCGSTLQEAMEMAEELIASVVLDLMQAIGNYMYKSNPNTRIIYCTGEVFANEVISAIMNSQNESFRKKFRNRELGLYFKI